MGLFSSFQLKSKDPDTRRRAALKLGTPGHASSIESLRPLALDDPEWSVREAAAQALGAIGAATAAPLLLDAIRKTAEVRDAAGAAAVRAAAIAGLGAIGSAAAPAVLAALRDRDARLREAAIEALGGIGGADAVEALATALADDRSNVRQAAAPALARAGGVESIPSLRSALSHKDAATRRSAAMALGTLADDRAAEALRAAAADRDRQVRDAVMHALAALRSPAAIDVLCGSLLEGDREAKGLAAASLRSFDWSPAGAREQAVHDVLHGRYADAASRGEEALAPLAWALTDREASVRREAVEALGALDDPRVVRVVSPLLADQDGSVRDAAARSLAKRGVAASPELARALADRGPVRDAAAAAVAAIGEARVAAALIDPLLSGQPGRHGGLVLRIVSDPGDLDAARDAADLLEILVGQLHGTLPLETLQAVAALQDVMLVEPGQRPDPDGRVDCEALRTLATKELERRGSGPV